MSGIVDAPGLAFLPGVIAARVDGCAMRPIEANKAESEELLVCYTTCSALRLMDKRTQLAEALGTRRCHIAGLQVGRSRKAAVWRCDGSLRVVAPSGGCNYVWVSDLDQRLLAFCMRGTTGDW